MKKYFRIVFSIALLCQFQYSIAQKNTQSKDSIKAYYARLAKSESKEDKAVLEKKLYQLLNSKDEEDWNTSANFFYQLNKPFIVDSIRKAIKIKFPLGMDVRDAAADTIYKQKDPVKKEKLYKAWVKKFPPEKFPSQKYRADRINYDYARSAIATTYAKADNVKKALEYTNMIETTVWKGEGWSSVAEIFAKKNHLEAAAMLFKKARDNSYKYIHIKEKDNGAMFAASGYVSYNTSLADVLYKQKKYTEALKYIKEAYANSGKLRANLNSTYANILMALGRNKEAFEKMNEAITEGQATQEMKENLKTLYAKVKGSNEGYEEYMASLNKILIEKMRKEVAKQIISKPAAMFTLQDVDGKTVSLEDYKGKTIVLDFWATWCGPCKRSFPAMKLAVNKYKDDPNVKFFFIHTWEREGDATSDAKKYMSAQNYPFEVLMDLKETGTGINKVVESYKVSSIPAKFVIDKNGNIRFALSGFSGGDDAALEELSAMIEMVQK